jgi:hypothetical protein
VCWGKPAVLHIYHDGPNKAMGLALHYFFQMFKNGQANGKVKTGLQTFIWFSSFFLSLVFSSYLTD